MGLGSSLKKVGKQIEKQVKRSSDQIYKQAVRSVSDYSNMVVQAATGGTVGISDDFSLRSGDGIGRATQEVRDNWTKWRTPLLMGASAIAIGTGVGAGLGAALGAAGLVAGGAATGAAAGATTGAISGTVSGVTAAGATSYSEAVGREQERDAAEYAAEVDRMNKSYEIASLIQSQEARTVNPYAYYNVYRRYMR